MWCAKRSPRTRFDKSRVCGSTRARPCMCGEPRDMGDGTGTLDLKAGNGLDPAITAAPPSHAPVALGVPAFLVPKSLGEVKELARMIALAEWAPDCYRDL